MIYKYKTATGPVEIDVSEEWVEKLQELDRKEQANDKMESRRHLSLDTNEGSWLFCEDEGLNALFCEKVKSNKERLHEAMNKLKSAQKEIIMMSYFEGKTQEEIAVLLGITQQAVSLRIMTAEKNLKKFFEKTL